MNYNRITLDHPDTKIKIETTKEMIKSLDTINVSKSIVRSILRNIADDNETLRTYSLKLMDTIIAQNPHLLQFSAEKLLELLSNRPHDLTKVLHILMRGSILHTKYRDEFIQKVIFVYKNNPPAKEYAAKVIREIAAYAPCRVRDIIINTLDPIDIRSEGIEEIIVGFALAYRTYPDLFHEKTIISILFELSDQVLEGYSSINWSITYALSIMFLKNPKFIRGILTSYIEHRSKTKEHQTILKDELRSIRPTTETNVQQSLIRFFLSIRSEKSTKTQQMTQEEEEYTNERIILSQQDRSEKGYVPIHLSRKREDLAKNELTNEDIRSDLDKDAMQETTQDMIVLQQIIDVFSSLNSREDVSLRYDLHENKEDFITNDRSNRYTFDNADTLYKPHNNTSQREYSEDTSNNNTLIEDVRSKELQPPITLKKEQIIEHENKIEHNLHNLEIPKGTFENSADSTKESLTNEIYKNATMHDVKYERIENINIHQIEPQMHRYNTKADQNIIEPKNNHEIKKDLYTEIEKDNIYTKTKANNHIIEDIRYNLKEHLTHRYDNLIDNVVDDVVSAYESKTKDSQSEQSEINELGDFIKSQIAEGCPKHGIANLLDMGAATGLSLTEQVELIIDGVSKILKWDLSPDNIKEFIGFFLESMQYLPNIEEFANRLKEEYGINFDTKEDLKIFFAEIIKLYKEIYPEIQVIQKENAKSFPDLDLFPEKKYDLNLADTSQKDLLQDQKIEP